MDGPQSIFIVACLIYVILPLTEHQGDSQTLKTVGSNHGNL